MIWSTLSTFVPLAAQISDTVPAISESYRITGSFPVNVRAEPRLDSSVLTTLAPGTTIDVLATVTGDMVSGNATWLEFLFEERMAYTHISLLEPVPSAVTVESEVAVGDGFAEYLPVSTSTANRAADPTAQAILSYLYSLTEKTENRVISGQFGAYGRGTNRASAENQLTKIFDQAAAWPALTGMDYAQWDRSQLNDFSEPNAFLIEQWELNSLVNVSWHAPNPWTGGSSTDWENPDTEDPYDTRDVLELITPGNAVHDEWMLMLDDIAGGLQELQQAGVVVMWRPFHEMNGGWAWWHRQDVDSYVGLWRHMFDYFTNEKGLNNLLWTYSPNTNSNQWDYGVLHFYPGDTYVDLVGLDKYMRIGEDPLVLNAWNEYNDLVSTGKPIGLFEFGPMPPTGQGWDTVEYNYFNLIRDIRDLYPRIILFQAWEYVWQIGNHSNAEGLLNDPWVLTRDELPEWTSSIGESS